MPSLIFLGSAIWSIFGFQTVIKVLRGQVQPNKVTWLLWAVAPMIATIAGISEQVGLAIFPVFISGFIPLLVFLASFVNKDAYWKASSFDFICAAFSIFALILWFLTKNPNLAIFMSILSDGLAAFPTLLKAWKFPKTENLWFYLGGLFSALTSFSVIVNLKFADLAFPIYLVVLNLCLFIILIVKSYL